MKLYFSVLLKNIQEMVDPRKFPFALREGVQYVRDVKGFKKEYAGGYPVKVLPVFFEKTRKSTFDPHYVYQAYWATKRIIREKKPGCHVDISSNISFLTQLSAMLPVIQLEYRPPGITLADCKRLCGNILNLPFSNQSLQSVSCLHVVEHIGLGRYGDPLKNDGWRHALSELQRIVAPEGNLFLSVPVGKPVVYFNANYIFSALDIQRSLADLELAEFSFVDDEGYLHEYGNMADTFSMKYALGLFHFRRSKSLI